MKHTFLQTYNLLPKEFKKKSLLFIFLLIFTTIFETLGIGLIFPLLDIIINKEFTKNLFGINLYNISQNYETNDIIVFLASFILILFLIKSVYLTFFSYWSNKFSQELFKALSLKSLKIYIYQDVSFYFEKNSSELLRNTLNECKQVGAIVLCYLRLIIEVVVSIAIIILIFYINFFISSLTLLLFVLLTTVYYFLLKKRIYNYGLIRQQETASKIKILTETFGGIKDIKLKSIESFFIKIYDNAIHKFIDASYKQGTLNELPKIIIELIFIFTIVSIVFVSLFISYDLQKILPLLGLYVAASFKLMPCLSKILTNFQNIQSMKVSAELLTKEFFLNKDYESYKIKENTSFKFKNEIKLNNISFSYNKKDADKNFETRKILNNFSHTIKKETSVGIIGKSGKGKSTIIDLITGILSPNEGEVLVDQQNIKNNIKGWQKCIGYVSQNIFLSDSTIKSNIALGIEPNKIDRDILIKSAEDAKILDFINTLKDGFETQIGEKGVKLSGGQKQRLAIARELYRKPSLLILDEATSGLDIETENEILKGLEKIKKEITIIIVSHRKNTVKNCDKIIDIDLLKYN
tara:strand:+ start:3581 stop:5317 length:1737 start_codon:yes stop_codon:yes gene_type:complete